MSLRYWSSSPQAMVLITVAAALSLCLRDAVVHAGPIAEGSGPPDDLTRLSLTDLANIDVTSVSKSVEELQRAAASVFVITHDDILRSGATSIPEVLRLAPNLLVTQLTSSSYSISARGFGGNPNDQNFANKLLMLIDGRSVYTPLFSGIYADAQDVLLEDVERIEVISGPGATLWGANAMNGVINIITRASYLTQGSYVDVGGGNQEQDTSARFGGRTSDETTYRVYGMALHRGALDQQDGASAADAWSKAQGGFRADWSTDHDTVTVQGDLYRGTEKQLSDDDLLIAGGNVLTRYQHHGDREDLQIQAYFDQTERVSPLGQGAFVVHTYDLELQQSLAAGSLQRIVWGGGERVNSYGITDTSTLLFVPPHHALTLANAFIQDTLQLAKSLNMVVGIKLEDDPYWGWTPLPDARVSWQMTENSDLWGAASRAIRSPTPFDDEVEEKMGSAVFLAGNTRFRPESVTAYEFGSRTQAAATLSLSVAAFYNVYDDLRTVEPAPVTVLPLYWGNLMRGDTYGVEAWANWQAADWWRLSPGFTALREQLRFKPGASGLLGIAQAADDPSSHATLTSSMDLGHRTTFDATLRYGGALPDPALAHYYEVDARVGWRPSHTLEVSLSALNLLHARHSEFAAPSGEYIPRSVMAEARCRF